MPRTKPLVAETRKYLVTTVAQAKEITKSWLTEIQLEKVIALGLPEIDVVMDPFAGSGIVGVSAARQERRFVLFETNPEYIELMRQSVGDWLGKAADNILWVNCEPALPVLMLFEEPESYNGRIAHS